MAQLKSGRSPEVEGELDRLFRRESGRAVAHLAKIFGDIDRAEDAVQDAYVRLLQAFNDGRLPEQPAFWIVRTARNCAVDRIRREKVGSEKTVLLARLEPPASGPSDDVPIVADDRLELIFTCCHPALKLETRVALTLRTLCGLSAAQIAAAFFVPEATMQQRLVRARRKVREAAIPFRMPPAERLRDRLSGVLGVVYLIFNEGYKATTGENLVASELCEEALRLAALVHKLLPNEPDALGLYALVLLQHSRRDQRADENGALLTLEEQDRSRWDRAGIERALALLGAAANGEQTSYLIEAQIAAEHAAAASFSQTNWLRIAALYEVLAILVRSPAVDLNRAVAVGMAFGYERGLAALDSLSAGSILRDHYLLHAARADLLRRLARRFEAEAAYRRALDSVPTFSERRYLERRLSELERLDP